MHKTDQAAARCAKMLQAPMYLIMSVTLQWVIFEFRSRNFCRTANKLNFEGFIFVLQQ